ncbi:MAG: hypothetical protein NVSMB3_07510 [Acidobacteriaceae bacterium]
MPLAEQMESTQEKRSSLLFREPANEEDDPFALLCRVWKESVQVHPGVVGENAIRREAPVYKPRADEVRYSEEKISAAHELGASSAVEELRKRYRQPRVPDSRIPAVKGGDERKPKGAGEGEGVGPIWAEVRMNQPWRVPAKLSLQRCLRTQEPATQLPKPAE